MDLDYQHIQQLQKQMAYEQSMGAQRGNSQCLGVLHQDGRLEAYGASIQNAKPPAPSVGVIGMTENAHCAFQALSNAICDLQERLGPITESYPEPGLSTNGQNQIAEASAVVALRILVERIEGKTAEIHRLLAALRV